MKFKLSQLLFLAYFYLLLPFMIFIAGWVKLVYALPLILLSLFLVYLLYKDSQEYYDHILISKKMNIVLVLSLTLWIIGLGIFGIFSQSGDMTGRNAMFKDLVDLSWPVIYPVNGAVVYYHGHWLVAALIGKLMGYTIAQIALFLWSLLGLVLVVLLLFQYLHIRSFKQQVLTLVIFMFFSPIFWNGGGAFYNYGLFVNYSSQTTQLYFSINQSIALWIMTILFLHQKSLRTFAFLGLIIMLYSPYTIFCIVPLMAIKVYQKLIKSSFKETVIEIFSMTNIVSLITIAPILFIYYISNATTNDGFSFMLNKQTLLPLLILVFQGFLAYQIIIFPKFKKDPMFWAITFVAIILSTIKYSTDQNFSRTINGALFICMVYVLKFLWDSNPVYKKRQTILAGVLIWACCIGSVWFISNIVTFMKHGFTPMKFYDYREKIYNYQWSNKNYQETFFFKYLSR